MLVLTRRVGEDILIDKGQIRIRIIYLRNRTAIIGIQAPAHIDVDREEIFLDKQDSLSSEEK